MIWYVLVLAVAAITTYLVGFSVRRMAVRFGAVVLPDGRKVHVKPTPTVGGVAMFSAFLIAMGLAWRLPYFREVFAGSSEPLGVVLAVSVIFLIGLVDDFRDVSAPAKLAGQVLAGSILYFLGVTLFFFRVPFGGLISLSADLQPLITVLWVVAIANAINLIDGLDGLAAGIVAIAAGAFFFYANRLFDNGNLGADNVGLLIAAITFGVCLGFLPHNIHPARIFMGDSGAMVLGVLMASSTIVVGGRTDVAFSGQTYFFFAPMVIPFFILGVPLLDTAFAVVRRAVRRTALSTADKEHLHHRLMRLGHGHRRAVFILWAWTAILSAFVLFPPFTGEGNSVIPFVVAGLGAALYTLFHPGGRASAEVDAQVDAQVDANVEAEPDPSADAEVGAQRDRLGATARSENGHGQSARQGGKAGVTSLVRPLVRRRNDNS